MKKTLFYLAVVFVMLTALTACSAVEGQMGKTIDHFEDEWGRVCTVVKWGDSASLDCDWRQ